MTSSRETSLIAMGRRAAPILLTALGLVTAAPDAHAQARRDDEALRVGAFRFLPVLELRVRAEMRTDPLDRGGAWPSSTAVLGEGEGGRVPVAALTPRVDHTWTFAERARVGLAASRGPVTARVVLQDARELGASQGEALAPIARPELPSFGPYEAFVEVRAAGPRATRFRLGRQVVVWGDGRLLGASDFSATGRSLDAARFELPLGDLDLELLAVLLAPPGDRLDPLAEEGSLGVVPSASSASLTPRTTVAGPGAQLFGARAAWHFAPLLSVEGNALSRHVRSPHPTSLTPSDVVALGARVFGDERGFHYAAEGVYELGRVAGVGENRSIAAFAGAARASWETALPWHLTFGAQGAYATGDDGPRAKGATQRRFDPLLPDEHDLHGAMGLYAWSNLIEGGADVGVRPFDGASARLAYRLALLAEPTGRWTSADLAPLGDGLDAGRTLGHEVDVTLSYARWDALRFDAGYGLFLFGDGAKAIATAAGRGAASMQHWAFLGATVTAP
jgi:hypothetical protein